MTLMQSFSDQEDAVERGTLIVELLDGRRYQVLCETWDEGEQTVSFESAGVVIASFNKAHVLLVRSADEEEIHLLSA